MEGSHMTAFYCISHLSSEPDSHVTPSNDFRGVLDFRKRVSFFLFLKFFFFFFFNRNGT
uniref:Uncharacterized protein n=1 Tax=Anguilla anguilla TaxID=7936 RepID=A0A0E9X010_ANGAN